MNIHDKADSILREQAIANLADKLQEGKKVGRCDFAALLDCELNDSKQYPIVHSEIAALLLSSSENRKYLSDKIRDGIIERYLNHPDQEWIVSEEMAAIESEEPDEYDYLRETEAAA